LRREEREREEEGGRREQNREGRKTEEQGWGQTRGMKREVEYLSCKS
jgi:hypothetical protein